MFLTDWAVQAKEKIGLGEPMPFPVAIWGPIRFQTYRGPLGFWKRVNV